MILVRKHITTETAHRLIDYVGKCAHIHGHSYRWEVEVEAPVKPNGISVDFSDLKQILQDLVYQPYDHKLVLCDSDPIIKLIDADLARDLLRVAVVSNEVGLCRVPFNPTAENLAAAVGRCFQKQLTDSEHLISLTCWETENSYAKYKP